MGFSAHDALVLLALLALLVAGTGLLVLAPLLGIPYPILLVLGGLSRPRGRPSGDLSRLDGDGSRPAEPASAVA